MEKRIPHCDLARVRSLIGEGKVRSTFTAAEGGKVLGCNFAGMKAIVLALTPQDFYKSMTTYADVTHLAGRLPSKHQLRQPLSQARGYR